MKKQNKGFTIVELVIVIAVIAVLAAVLIPTFSSLIKKANLSADKAAVRDMNTALAADQALHGKPADIETVMTVLANAGFNTINWNPVSKDYAVYWYKEGNVMILYNAKTASIEYPDEYAITWKEGTGSNARTVNLFTATTTAGTKFAKYGTSISVQEYNHNIKEALETDLSLDSNSATGGKKISEMISDSGEGGSGSGLSSSEKENLQQISTALGTSEIKSVLNLDSNSEVYVNANTVLKSTNDETATTYASMNIMSVGDSAVDYQSSGEAISNNMYYISITEAPNATASQVQSAQAAAGKYVYTLFAQINEKKIDNGAAIVLKSGTTIDVSGNEWAPAKRFAGYFGTTDAANPVVVSGARLTSATSYSATIYFNGSAGKYFVTGFFGTLYGDTTVENVRFESMNIDQPATDFDLADSKMTVSRNSVSIFGGVIDGYFDDNDQFHQVPANVVLRNIEVAKTVTITGSATAAGLVAYVGGCAGDNALFNGSLLIDNCRIHAKVTGLLDVTDNVDYGPCGGIIGFACRANESTSGTYKTDGDSATGENYDIIVKNCVFDGTLDGYKDLGGCIGNIITGRLILQGENHFEDATYNDKGYSTSDNTQGGVAGLVENAAYLVFDDSAIKADPSKKVAYIKDGMPVYSTAKRATVVTTLTNKDMPAANARYATVKDADNNNIGANNGTK